jgi:hypothetical protein
MPAPTPAIQDLDSAPPPNPRDPTPPTPRSSRPAWLLVLLVLASLAIPRFSHHVTAATQDHRGPLVFAVTWNPRTGAADGPHPPHILPDPAEGLDFVGFDVRHVQTERFAGLPVRLRRTIECWTYPPKERGGPTGTADLAWTIIETNSEVPDLATWFNKEDIQTALARGEVSSTRLDPWAIALLAFPLAAAVLALYFLMVGVRSLWNLSTDPPPATMK